MKHVILSIGFFAGLASSVVAHASVFEGRSSNGAVDNLCTSHGGNGAIKCAMFYDRNLDMTIVNNWNIGQGSWDGSAIPATGTAQAIAAKAGVDVSGLTGWVLPTGDASKSAGAENQLLSIWNDAGQSLAGLQAQFDGVQPAGAYWSGTTEAPFPPYAFYLRVSDGNQNSIVKGNGWLYALATRPGDVAVAVPEPETYVMLVAGLLVVVGLARQSSKKQ